MMEMRVKKANPTINQKKEEKKGITYFIKQ